MKFNFTTIVIIIGIFFFVNGFSEQKKNNTPYPKDSVVATVGKIKITIDEYLNGYEYGPAFYKRSKDSKKNYLNYLIREKLLALDGYFRNLDTTRSVVETFNAFRDDLATEELFKDEILSKANPTEAEIDTVARQKLIDVELQWLYSPSQEEIVNLQDSLRSGVEFQKLFNKQLNDSVAVDDRALKSSRYHLGMKNPDLAKITDILVIGKYSAPIKSNNGWYIILLKNFNYNLVITESEEARVKNEARQAVIKKKMDELSDKYVNGLLLEQNPVIKRKPFQILRSYLGMYQLSQEKYKEWQLSEKLKEALNEYNSVERKDYSKISLVELKDYNISLENFLIWYRVRDQYLKFDKRSFAQYSFSLEQMVWRMIRDRILSQAASLKGYYDRKVVKDQSKLWMDKILYGTVKDEIINSIIIENKEIKLINDSTKSISQSEFIENELTKKLFRKINELKKKYLIKINEKILAEIKVSDEENPNAIELYTVKRGGLIPRTPYPAIDNYWVRWQ